MTRTTQDGTRAPARPARVFQAVVFDCDGVLVDSSAAWAGAFGEGAAAAGFRLADQHHRALLGSSAGSAAAQIAGWAGLPDAADAVRAQISESLRAAVRSHPPHPLPGVVALLAELRQRVPLAVASNAPGDVLAAELQASGLYSAFDEIVSADDVREPKPAPDIYLAACAALGVNPATAVALEDSADGATAAQRANLSLVVVTDRPWPQHRPLEWPAQRRPALYVTSLRDPSVRPYLLATDG
jgi:HAD superfamily hydrolase (TIGR01509 family)